MGFIQEFAKLCNQMEGWRPGTAAWVNNNPLNLDAPTPRSRGRDDKGRAIFQTVADGWADGETYIASHIESHPGLSLRTFFAGQRDDAGKVVPGGYSGFAPAGDTRGRNVPNIYAGYLAHGLQITLDEALAPLLATGAWPKPKPAAPPPTTAPPPAST